ncbi:MAG: molybdopterin converting factor subunit 1 [Deltaproteobacteria bacterium]|nr:molybdopterin converting factor subunit 1 [Deltaproteobacteria bacterium]
MITVRFFAMLKGKVGKEEVKLPLPGPITFGELRDLLKKEFPAIAEHIEKRSIMVSVNQELATSDTIIKDGDEIALLPPFSGG